MLAALREQGYDQARGSSLESLRRRLDEEDDALFDAAVRLVDREERIDEAKKRGITRWRKLPSTAIKPREEHAELDGEEFDFDEMLPPPWGFGCQCGWELVKDDKLSFAFDPSQPRDEDGKWSDGSPILQDVFLGQAHNTLRDMLLAFDPSQPRDEDGKWTNGGRAVGGKYAEAYEFLKAKAKSTTSSLMKSVWEKKIKKLWQVELLEAKGDLVKAQQLKKTIGVGAKTLHSKINYIEQKAKKIDSLVKAGYMSKADAVTEAKKIAAESLTTSPSLPAPISKLHGSMVPGSNLPEREPASFNETKRTQWENSLSPEEYKAFRYWGTSYSAQIKASQLGPGHPYSKEREFSASDIAFGRAQARAMEKAYKAAETQGALVKGTVYRGQGKVPDELWNMYTSPGTVMRFDSFDSFSRRKHIGFGSWALEVRDVTKGVSIENTTGHPREQEVIFKPGWKIKILRVEDYNTGKAFTNKAAMKGRKVRVIAREVE